MSGLIGHTTRTHAECFFESLALGPLPDLCCDEASTFTYSKAVIQLVHKLWLLKNA